MTHSGHFVVRTLREEYGPNFADAVGDAFRSWIWPRSSRRHEWLRSGLVIFVLIILSMLVAQSWRNCEVPGSTWIPNHHNKHRFSE
jgi:hypothetical protein